MSESESDLPSFLYNTEPMDPEDIPLQVALLTMEAARLWSALGALGRECEALCRPAPGEAPATAPAGEERDTKPILDVQTGERVYVRLWREWRERWQMSPQHRVKL
jgi:hypothetical protein